MGKYILIGIPCSGKTTIGSRAAEALSMPFHNTDNMAIERSKFESPTDIFMSFGKERIIEEAYKILCEIPKLKGSAIIEVWPEGALMPKSVALIKKAGTVIYVKRAPEAAVADTKKDKNRMILRDRKNGLEIDMRVECVKMYAKKLSRFEALADLTLENNGSLDEAVEKLTAMIAEREEAGK